MKYISTWAKHHIAIARIILILGKTGMIVMAVYLGGILAQAGVLLPESILYSIAILTLLLILLYPAKQPYKKNTFYYRQKCCDFLIGLAGFISITCMVNRLQIPALLSTPLFASYIAPITPAQKILLSLENKEGKVLTLKEKKILRKEFGRQLKIYSKATLLNDNEKKNNAGKIILVIVAAVGLSFLLAMLACSIACNGAEIAAVIVVALGLTAIIWGMVAIIKRINRGAPRKEVQGE